MKKLVVTIATIIVLLIAAITTLVLTYSKSAPINAETFPINTTVNGIDCSNLTYEQAEAKLTKHWNSRHIEVTCNLNVRSASFTDYGYEYDLEESLENVNGTRIVSAALNHYFGIPYRLNIPMTVKSFDEDFKKEVFASDVFKLENITKAENAYVDLSDPNFAIVNHAFGNEPDMDRVFTALTESISKGEINFVFDEKKYSKIPKVMAHDEGLHEYQQFCREYLTQDITYELGKETFTISAEDLASMMKDDLSGRADKKAVKKYVSQLANKYDNINSTREFKSLTGKDVTVPPGTYGWMIDQPAEVKRLIKDIESHENISRDPIFAATGYGEYTRDMGDTYIDVDISEQEVNFYKNGKLIFSSPCVTGNRLTGTVTDVGAYYILNKIRNVVLRGDNGDGTEYESFVSYWLGINWAGEGFHDASWRGSFGGSIWTYNGSHGCINMPTWRMPELYEKAEVDIPVAVHY